MRFPPGRTPVCVVVVLESNERANQRQLVGHAGQAWHQFADLQPLDVGVDGSEISTDFQRRVRLEIVHVQVGRTAWQEHHNDAFDGPLGPVHRVGTGLCPENIGE